MPSMLRRWREQAVRVIGQAFRVAHQTPQVKMNTNCPRVIEKSMRL